MAIMKAIVAVDKDWAIGKDGKLLYHIPEDMDFFRDMTIGNTVVMGRGTFTSIGSRILPKRRNIIITHHGSVYRSGYRRMFISSEGFDKLFKRDESDSIYFIIGGEDIYKKYYRQCSEIYVTMIDDEAKDPDKYFPDLNYCNEFKLDVVISSGEYKGIKFKITRWVKVK